VSARTIHVCLSVRGALRWDRRTLARACKGVTMPDGRRPTPDELRDHLMDLLADGNEVVPLGDPCEGFDPKTGCPGHETAPAHPQGADETKDGGGRG